MTWVRLVVPVTGLLVLSFFVYIYLRDPTLYHHALSILMLAPFPHPFIDWEWIPSAIDCWKHGVDVYRDNTCYTPVAHGRYNYSPLWLRATFLPTGQEWVRPFGLAFAVLFYASLAFLPPPRRRLDLVVMLLAVLSSLTAFALERGNVDVVIFLLTMIGAQLWFGSLPQRLGGYAIFTFVALLKFYPLVLLILTLREGIRAFIPIWAAVIVALILFVLAFQSELLLVTGVTPSGSYFTDLFGAVNLPYGLASFGVRLAHKCGATDDVTLTLVGAYMPVTLLVLLVMEATVRAVWLAERGGVRSAMAKLSRQEAGLLIVGATLICGCFFMGQSVGYRGIFLLFALPGLLRLSQMLPSRAGRGLCLITCVAIVFVMWVLFIQFCIFVASFSGPYDIGASPIWMLHWLLHELAWWWIVGVLLSTVVAFVQNSEMYRVALSCVKASRTHLTTD